MRGGLPWAESLFRQELWHCLGHGRGHRILANSTWYYGEEGIEVGQGWWQRKEEGENDPWGWGVVSRLVV